MGIEVVQGRTSFRVRAIHATAFLEALCDLGLDKYWSATRGSNGDVIDLVLQVGKPCEYRDMVGIAPFVERGSFISLETAWSDDAWRWVFTGRSCTEIGVCASARAR